MEGSKKTYLGVKDVSGLHLKQLKVSFLSKKGKGEQKAKQIEVRKSHLFQQCFNLSMPIYAMPCVGIERHYKHTTPGLNRYTNGTQ